MSSDGIVCTEADKPFREKDLTLVCVVTIMITSGNKLAICTCRLAIQLHL